MRSKSQLAFLFIFFSFLSSNALGQEKNRELFERFQNGAYTENLPLIRKLAEEGDATAQYYMGEAYYSGWGVQLDNQVALVWIQKSAQQENKQAENLMGIFYHLGGPVDPDPATSLEWFKKAANHGDESAQVNLGVRYYTGSQIMPVDYKKSAEYLLPLAQKQDPNFFAAYYVGLMAYYGLGQPVDIPKGIKFITLAADNNIEDAQYALGSLYKQGGKDLNQDAAKAFKYTLAAAENDHGQAQWEVGMAFIRGTNVTADIPKAIQWFQKSANNGDSNGMISLAVMYATGTGVLRDYNKTYALYLRAARIGNGYGAKGIATMYQQGQNLNKSMHQAVKWATIGVLLGNKESQQVLDNFSAGLSPAELEKAQQEAQDWIGKNIGVN